MTMSVSKTALLLAISVCPQLSLSAPARSSVTCPSPTTLPAMCMCLSDPATGKLTFGCQPEMEMGHPTEDRTLKLPRVKFEVEVDTAPCRRPATVTVKATRVKTGQTTTIATFKADGTPVSAPVPLLNYGAIGVVLKARATQEGDIMTVSATLDMCVGLSSVLGWKYCLADIKLSQMSDVVKSTLELAGVALQDDSNPFLPNGVPVLETAIRMPGRERRAQGCSESDGVGTAGAVSAAGSSVSTTTRRGHSFGGPFFAGLVVAAVAAGIFAIYTGKVDPSPLVGKVKSLIPRAFGSQPDGEGGGETNDKALNEGLMPHSVVQGEFSEE